MVAKIRTLEDALKDDPDLFDKMANKAMDNEFQEVREVYIDLNCLKDVRLGLLISLCTKDRLNYIKAGIERYNRRPIRSFTYAYPDFPYTEEQLTKMYYDPNFQMQAFNHAPDTSFSAYLAQFVDIIHTRNVRAEYKGDTRIMINVYPLPVNQIVVAYQQLLNMYFTNSKVKFRLVSIDPLKVTAEQWGRCFYQFIDDIALLHNPKSGWFQACYQQRRFLHYRVYAALSADSKTFAHWQKELDLSSEEMYLSRFELTELATSIMTQFKFVKFDIPYTAPQEDKKING